VGRAVGVVLNAFDFGRNGVLVAFEVHHTVVVLVTAAFVANRDMTVVVTARLLELRLKQCVSSPCEGGHAKSSPSRACRVMWVSS
jgi:hypothetical protein